MMSLRGSSGNQRWLCLALLSALSAGVPSGAVIAQDRFFVEPDGRRIPLIRSVSELAVTFESVDKVAPCARRLAAQGRGVIKAVPGAQHSRIKLLHVADTSPRRRSLLRRDPAILEVRPVYHVEGDTTPLLSTGTIVVRLRSELDEVEREELWNAYRVEVVEPVEGLEDVYCVKPPDDDEDEVLRAQWLAADHRTVWSQPNFRQPHRRRQVVPLDQYFGWQWYLSNTGQTGGRSGADISALGAWLRSEGQDVLIGMFDDACDVEHEDMVDNYIGIGHDPSFPATDEFRDQYEDPRPKQIGDRHGTAVMGLAVARANSVGIRGVASLSRFTLSRGLGELLTYQQDASVYTFARQQDVDVHINSWGYESDAPNPAIVVDAIRTAFEQGRDPDGEEGNEEPLGMVIVFASGNGRDGDGVAMELTQGKDLSTLPTVIGVGASTADDRVASYSNYGPDIDLLAPGGDELTGMATVDNDDDLVFVDDGYNIGGFTRLGDPDLDPRGRYTMSFSGTSAACPIAAGVAALILSANPLLTATDVRIIMEHTADRISPDDANYNNIAGRCLKYGYGRVNAERAVISATEALTNGLRSWPDRVADPRVQGAKLAWRAGFGSAEFLIIESSGDFTFTNDLNNPFPRDGVCYSTAQLGCQFVQVEELGAPPTGVTITGVVRCGEGKCELDDEQELEDVVSTGAVMYAVYARNGIGRYSWGVEARIMEGGPDDDNGSGSNGAQHLGPKVTIMASVTEGVSPLTVVFTGNAQRTNADIDETRTQWDFDINDDVLVDATKRNASYTYVVPAGETRTFIARLTMYDVDGIPGSAQAVIRVQGRAGSDTGGDGGQSAVRIIIGIPGTVDSDVSQGTSPLSVQLSVDASTLIGTLESVLWDLGDGTVATSIVVPHTYINETDAAFRIPITTTVRTRTAPTIIQTTVATRVLTVLPGVPVDEQPDPNLPGTGVPGGGGGSGAACGVFGMLPLFVLLTSMMCLRRWRF